MKFFLLTSLIIFMASFYLSLFEWILHKYFMHKPFLRFAYAFEAHALQHHWIFQSNQTYHLQHSTDKKTIPMAWWNGPVLISITTSPAITLSLLSGAWWISTGVFTASIIYFTIYEYTHWCMHYPKERFIEKTGLFLKNNGRHLLHHRWPNKNFNVVFPFADYIFGTLITRAEFNFNQARGRHIPDVQPKNQYD